MRQRVKHWMSLKVKHWMSQRVKHWISQRVKHKELPVKNRHVKNVSVSFFFIKCFLEPT